MVVKGAYLLRVGSILAVALTTASAAVAMTAPRKRETIATVPSEEDQGQGQEHVQKHVQNKVWRDECDLGFVQPGSRHYAVFEVVNAFDEPLKIRRVFSECTCMKALSVPKVIPGRSSIRVEVRFAAPDEMLHYDQHVILRTTDERRPAIRLRVKADVGVALLLEPPVLELGELTAGQRYEGQVLLINRDDKPVRVTPGASNEPGCFARVPHEAVPPHGQVALPLVVDVAADADEKGRYKRTIQLRTDHPYQRWLEAALTYTVRSPPAATSAPTTRSARVEGEEDKSPQLDAAARRRSSTLVAGPDSSQAASLTDPPCM